MTWNDVLTELSKPTWWISVVIVGIAINLLSAYLKSPLDTAFSSTSSWWRSRSEARRHEWEAYVTWLMSSDEARQIARFVVLRLKLDAIGLLLLAILVMLTPGYIEIALQLTSRLFSVSILALSTGILFLGSRKLSVARDIRGALREAQIRADNQCEHMEGERP